MECAWVFVEAMRQAIHVGRDVGLPWKCALVKELLVKLQSLLG